MTAEKDARIAELEAESASLTKALTGLTRGGSEYFIRKGDRFVADIPACVAYVRQIKEDAHRRTVNAILARNVAEEKLAIALAALKSIASRKQTASWDEVEAWELQEEASRAIKSIKEKADGSI
jgi:hypothetical protein